MAPRDHRKNSFRTSPYVCKRARARARTRACNSALDSCIFTSRRIRRAMSAHFAANDFVRPAGASARGTFSNCSATARASLIIRPHCVNFRSPPTTSGWRTRHANCRRAIASDEVSRASPDRFRSIPISRPFRSLSFSRVPSLWHRAAPRAPRRSLICRGSVRA